MLCSTNIHQAVLWSSPRSSLQPLNLIQLPEKAVWICSKWLFIIRRDELIYMWLSATVFLGLCFGFDLALMFLNHNYYKRSLFQRRQLCWTDLEEHSCLFLEKLNRMCLPSLSCYCWNNLCVLVFCRYDRLLETCSIALVGKYTKFSDSYASVIKALEHSALAINHKLDIKVGMGLCVWKKLPPCSFHLQCCPS